MILLNYSNCKNDDSIFISQDELSILSRSYSGSQLQVDGYYYTIANDRLFSASFFYRNGVFLNGGGSEAALDAMDEYIQNEFILRSGYKDYSQLWGVFRIESSSLKFERLYSSSGGPLKAYVNQGVILNDTTFLIQSSYRNQDGKVTEFREENETYHFRKFSPKPDSTNSFVP
jgi:hypothetical protein